jgi:hypothetical protein
LRVAIVASVTIHALSATALVVAVRYASPIIHQNGTIDTRADDVVVKLLADDPETAITVAVQLEPTPHPIADPPPRAAPAVQPTPEPSRTTTRTPHAIAVPGTLPPAILDRIRQPATSSLKPPAASHIQPASGATSVAPAASPIHGTMNRGQVVYLLDCSGSMGEFGKLALARAALLATLYRQTEEVRFQVIAYNTTARPVVAGGYIAATAANVATVEAALAEITAAGKSNHVVAIRRAGELLPDTIVLLTDAEDLAASAVKPALAAAGKTIPVFISKVSGNGIAPCRQLR